MIKELRGRALAFKCDVARAEDVSSAPEQRIEAFRPVDIVFNNAGVKEPIGTPAGSSASIFAVFSFQKIKV
jgi:NAD(P)-dependent dehydrogenase (short-subunit alcohol dehydrogenase family)